MVLSVPSSTANSTIDAISILSGSGKVGLGTSTPATRLDVVGDARVSTNLSVLGNATVTGQTSTGTLTVTNNGTVAGSFSIAGATTLQSTTVVNGVTTLNSNLLVPSANVGFGTGAAAPISRLQVDGVLSLTSAVAAGGTLHLANDANGPTGNFGVRLQGVDRGSGHDLAVLTRSASTSSFAESLTIKSGGNVGIGTVNPTQKLSVIGNGAFSSGLATNTSGSSDVGLTVGSTTGAGGKIRLVSGTGGWWGFGNDAGVLSLFKEDIIGAARTPIATFKQDSSAEFAGPIRASGFDARNQRTTSVGDPMQASDAANKRYVDSVTPWKIDLNGVSLKDTSGYTYVGIGTSLPDAPLHIERSTVDGEVGRFAPGGPFQDLGLRSYITLTNQNPSYWWELSAQDENGGGSENGFALRGKHADLAGSKPRLYVSPASPLNGAATARSFVRLYNENVDYAWDFSLQDSNGAGSLNSFALREKTGAGVGAPRLFVETGTGNIGIGTSSPGGYKLAVNGTIHTKEIVVDLVGWADYVFADDYRRMPLADVESHIKEHRHLPGIPSAKEVAEKGVGLGQMQAALLAKLEELTLHVIDQDKRLARLEKENAELRSAAVSNHLP